MVARRKPVVGRQRAAIDAAVSALPTGPEHAALVESCRELAELLDATPAPAFDDKLWREYRLALKALMDDATGGADGDDLDAEFDALRAEVGNTAKPRASNRRS